MEVLKAALTFQARLNGLARYVPHTLCAVRWQGLYTNQEPSSYSLYEIPLCTILPFYEILQDFFNATFKTFVKTVREVKSLILKYYILKNIKNLRIFKNYYLHLELDTVMVNH